MALKNVVPWNKNRGGAPKEYEIDSLHRHIDRLFSDFFPSFDMAHFGIFEEHFSPRINMDESEQAITITAELPGMDEQNVNIALENDRLIISGEKADEQKHAKDSSYYLERSFGSFRRVVALPSEVDPDRAKASFKNGILTINLTKTQAGKRRTIPIAH